jgi:hypothetical protein
MKAADGMLHSIGEPGSEAVEAELNSEAGSGGEQGHGR